MDGADQRVGFFLVPGFSMCALSSATEPLRAANRLAGNALFDWCLIGADGEPVRAGGGFRVIADHTIGEPIALDMLLVVSSLDVLDYRDRRLFAWLRRLAAENVTLGALSTGAILLARAGLLEGRRCTIHWQHQRDFAEEFPEIELTRDLYCIDNNRLTCAGGIAAMDLMLALISDRHGAALAAEVAENFLYGRLRPSSESQRMDRQWRYGVTNPRLVDAITLMEDHIEDPIPGQDIARVVGTSERQLERLFVQAFGKSPSRFYMDLRLKEARRLLRNSSESITEIARRCGFSSPSHFGRAFREAFQATPARTRRDEIGMHADPGRMSGS